MMLWFLESPAGLKLNHELGNFLSELFLWLIRLWTGKCVNWGDEEGEISFLEPMMCFSAGTDDQQQKLGCMQGIKPLTPQIIHVIGLSGIFGVSMIISMLSDLLAFMTLHVYCFYMVAARIFNWQLMILYSLFNLFRGKWSNEEWSSMILTTSTYRQEKEYASKSDWRMRLWPWSAVTWNMSIYIAHILVSHCAHLLYHVCIGKFFPSATKICQLTQQWIT